MCLDKNLNWLNYVKSRGSEELIHIYSADTIDNDFHYIKMFFNTFYLKNHSNHDHVFDQTSYEYYMLCFLNFLSEGWQRHLSIIFYNSTRRPSASSTHTEMKNICFNKITTWWSSMCSIIPVSLYFPCVYYNKWE